MTVTKLIIANVLIYSSLFFMNFYSSFKYFPVVFSSMRATTNGHTIELKINMKFNLFKKDISLCDFLSIVCSCVTRNWMCGDW